MCTSAKYVLYTLSYKIPSLSSLKCFLFFFNCFHINVSSCEVPQCLMNLQDQSKILRSFCDLFARSSLDCREVVPTLATHPQHSGGVLYNLDNYLTLQSLSLHHFHSYKNPATVSAWPICSTSRNLPHRIQIQPHARRLSLTSPNWKQRRFQRSHILLQMFAVSHMLANYRWQWGLIAFFSITLIKTWDSNN